MPFLLAVSESTPWVGDTIGLVEHALVAIVRRTKIIVGVERITHAVKLFESINHDTMPKKPADYDIADTTCLYEITKAMASSVTDRTALWR